MPKVAKELSSLEVKRLVHPGKAHNATFAVGGVNGLLLQLTPAGGKTWILRATVGQKRREIGLGGYPDVTLAQARERARETKDLIYRGVDPIEQRNVARAALHAAQRRGLTFSDAVDRYLVTKLDEFRNAKHRQQWENTLATYAVPQLGSMLVSDIKMQDVLRVVEPIWRTKTETASRLRGRIESVLSWATVAGHRSGDNPARWVGNLKEMLPAPSKVAKHSSQPAVQINDVNRWLAALRSRRGTSYRALEFLSYTAARSQEVRGATWDEIDFDRLTWVVPAARMKMGREHRVPLSLAAIDLLEKLPMLAESELVFPAPRGGVLSDMALSAAMRRMHHADLKEIGAGFVDRVSKRPAVPHGLRSTFRDWAAERTNFPGEMAELALAHRVSNSVEAAYRRGDMFDKRRRMMDAWSDFLGERAVGDVLTLRENI